MKVNALDRNSEAVSPGNVNVLIGKISPEEGYGSEEKRSVVGFDQLMECHPM